MRAWILNQVMLIYTVDCSDIIITLIYNKVAAPWET